VLGEGGHGVPGIGDALIYKSLGRNVSNQRQ
jgi:hypothetical protein